MLVRFSGGPGTSSADTTIYHPFATLTVTAPPADEGRSVAVDARDTFIGRDADCDLVLTNDHISRRHAVVRLRGREYEVEDLGSANGTRLNGELFTGPRLLHDGDRLALADVEVGFQFGDRPWAPTAPPDENGRRSLRQELHKAPGFSAGAMLLAVGGSVVGAILADAVRSGPWGALAGAALGPVVSTIFSTRQAGEKGRVRGAAIVILSLSAMSVTWTGFEVTDTVVKGSVLPGAGHRANTFPQIALGGPDKDGDDDTTTDPPNTPLPSPLSIVELAPVQCGSIDIGSEIACPGTTIRYNGGSRLQITSVEVTGRHSGDFTPGRECTDEWLDPGETCRMTVRFQPSGSGERKATLVVHQNLPKPDRGTRALLTGTGVTDG
jgi:hypothetical protein